MKSIGNLPRFLVTSLLLTALAACASPEEKLCKASLNQTLLNPETASYSGFSKLSDEDVKGDELLRGLKDILSQQVPTSGASYFQMKIRAEGELGNKITKRQFCAVDAAKKTCACVSSS